MFTAAVSKPYVTKLYESEDEVQLQCNISEASPGFKLNICWQENSGTILTETKVQLTEGGRSYILNTAVTKSGNYSCVATLEEINHQVYTETCVSVPGEFLSIIYMYLLDAKKSSSSCYYYFLRLEIS